MGRNGQTKVSALGSQEEGEKQPRQVISTISYSGSTAQCCPHAGHYASCCEFNSEAENRTYAEAAALAKSLISSF